MAQLNAVTVGNAHQSRGDREVPGPVALGVPAAEQAGACRQFGEQASVVVAETGVESALADAFDGVEDADSNDFADGEDGLGVAGGVGDGVIYFAEEFSDKVCDVPGVWFLLWDVCSIQDAGCRGNFPPAL